MVTFVMLLLAAPVLTNAAEPTECVRPTDEMRRNHMDMLRHDRVETLRYGVRAAANGKPLAGSLKGCINCHSEKDGNGNYYPIESSKHFCNSCHTYAAVKLYCFRCHSAQPEKF